MALNHPCNYGLLILFCKDVGSTDILEWFVEFFIISLGVEPILLLYGNARTPRQFRLHLHATFAVPSSRFPGWRRLELEETRRTTRPADEKTVTCCSVDFGVISDIYSGFPFRLGRRRCR
jgi:hypothetical protein